MAWAWHKIASDGVITVLELWGMLSTPSLLLLQGPLWAGLVVPVRISSMGPIELFNHLRWIIIVSYFKPDRRVQMIYITFTPKQFVDFFQGIWFYTYSKDREQILLAYGLPNGHLPPIMKTTQVRRTRHAGHCWRGRDELINDVLLWTPTHGQAKAGRPARTYI